jgi:hypothetical protein
MTTFNISDITPAGAFANAVAAAQENDRRNANRHVEPSEGGRVNSLFATLGRRIAAVITENRQTASRLTSRPV